MYCTCGHLLTDDSAENKRVHLSRAGFDLTSRTSRSGRAGHTVTSMGRLLACKEYHKANQLARTMSYRGNLTASTTNYLTDDTTTRKAMD